MRKISEGRQIATQPKRSRSRNGERSSVLKSCATVRSFISIRPASQVRSKRLSYWHSVASTGGHAFATRQFRLRYHRPADRKIGIFLPKLQGFAGLPQGSTWEPSQGRERVDAQVTVMRPRARLCQPKQSVKPATVTSIDTPTVSG
jgi:hypothetical protein